ncbi:VCBS repeat-containing protein [Streptomyces sp. NPDC097619]|uniref:FG-GAP repeat domain-containing protein n=1 Tax=Streptomyces sp. NPDC097619 TaxID=3157228 RepID=UPI00332C1936
MTQHHIPRSTLIAAVALSVAASGCAAATPAWSASSQIDAGAMATPAALTRISDRTEVVSAGTHGFAYRDLRTQQLMWFRYADRTAVEVGTSTAKGSLSDFVAIAMDGGLAGDPVEEIQVGNLADEALPFTTVKVTRAYFLGANGATLVTQPVGTHDVFLVDQTGSETRERAVTGLPADAASITMTASTPGSIALSFRSGSRTHDAVVDLGTAAVVKAFPRAGGIAGGQAGTALSGRFLSTWLPGRAGNGQPLRITDMKTGLTSDLDLGYVTRPVVGLVGNWAVHANRADLQTGSAHEDLALRATPVGGGPARKLLDHASSLTPTPDGGLLVSGGTLKQGEGIFKISADTKGEPVARMVASSGASMSLTLTGVDVPATTHLNGGTSRLRWNLSRPNAHTSLTLRHEASREKRVFSSDQLSGRDADWNLALEWDGLLGTKGEPFTGANGKYTWHLVARPVNGLGRDLDVSGSFLVDRPIGGHDYSNNGTPDVLIRSRDGELYRADTYQSAPAGVDIPQLFARKPQLIGRGWNIYDGITAVGNIAGASAGDLVARDKAGTLWLYLGKGDGTFTTRIKIGAGWNTYDRMTAMGDLTGDGLSDLVARDKAGMLWLYKATGNWRAPFSTRSAIGGGWNTYDRIAAVGNIAGASAGDLVARDKAGTLWLYLGKGDGTFTTRIKIGAAWNTYDRILGIGDTDNDGYGDLVAFRGLDAWRYKGSGNWRGPLADRNDFNLTSPGHIDIM